MILQKLRGLKLISQGKVRDVYEVDESTLLLVATDRVSAYDVILKTVISVVILPCKELTGRNRVIKPINDKGKILTQISVFWLGIVDHIPNHVITASVDEMPENVRPFKPLIEGRSMLVKKLKMFPFEFIVRGYLSGNLSFPIPISCPKKLSIRISINAGSAWREYKYSGTVWSKPLQPGLLESSKLEYCLYTPTTKEESGSGKHG